MGKLIGLLALFMIMPETGKTIDFKLFTMDVPASWEYVPKQGFDSFVGSIDTKNGDILEFDYGYYSNSLDGNAEIQNYSYDTIDNKKAKIVVPKKPGKGLTGVYFEKALDTI